MGVSPGETPDARKCGISGETIVARETGVPRTR